MNHRENRLPTSASHTWLVQAMPNSGQLGITVATIAKRDTRLQISQDEAGVEMLV